MLQFQESGTNTEIEGDAAYTIFICNYETPTVPGNILRP
jgi:hypothetical protein